MSIEEATPQRRKKMSINKVILSGGLVRKQELRDAGKSQVVSFTLVETQGYGDNETKQYHEIEAWGGTAKFVAEHLGKGAQIVIEGRLKNRSYEKDGHTVYRTSVVAEKLDAMTFGKREDGQSGQGPQNSENNSTGTTDRLPIFEDEAVEVISEDDIQF